MCTQEDICLKKEKSQRDNLSNRPRRLSGRCVLGTQKGHNLLAAFLCRHKAIQVRHVSVRTAQREHAEELGQLLVQT